MIPAQLHPVLAAVASRRALFHSEADLQHEVAWELRTQVAGAELRLERPFDLPERMNVDIFVGTPRADVAIELKYWPRAWTGGVGRERFNLKNRGAQDLGRYDFWKDVNRIEQLVSAGVVTWGAAVALTNDSAYWSVPRPGTMAEPFALHPGRRSPATLDWPRQTGTTRTRERPIVLAWAHDVQWRSFGATAPGDGLRYLALVVEALP